MATLLPVGRFDVRQLDVRAFREERMHGEAGGDRVQALRGRVAKDDALRIADS